LCTLTTPPALSVTLFPYTTLFRSTLSVLHHNLLLYFGYLCKSTQPLQKRLLRYLVSISSSCHLIFQSLFPGLIDEAWRLTGSLRSEEHTSELQSRFDLVCRLLLEK